MPAMIVSVNGRRACSVRLTLKNTRSLILSWIGPDIYGSAGGMDGDRHLRWDLPRLKIGDTIEVKLAETAKTDPPDSRKTILQSLTPAERKRYRKQQLTKRRKKNAAS